MDDDVRKKILAMSGRGCFDSVAPEFSAYATHTAGLALEATLCSLISYSPDELYDSFKRPEIVVVRTPRAQPYSFVDRGRYYTVLDEHLSRHIHRWSRFADLSSDADGRDAVRKELEVVHAERAYIFGDLVGCAKYFGSMRCWEVSSPDPFAFSSEGDERHFRSRSLHQHVFVAAHEIAHVILLQLDAQHLAHLRAKMLGVHVGGLEKDASFPQDTPKWLLPSGMIERIAGDPFLLDECLCDALSIAALIWHGVAWPDALAAALESIYLLWGLAEIDGRSRWVVAQLSGEQASIRASNEKVIGTFVLRVSAVLWLSNMAQKVLDSAGLGSLAGLGFLRVDEAAARNKAMLDVLHQFWPGKRFLDYLNSSPDPRDEDLERLVQFMLHSRQGAHDILGFATPQLAPETGVTSVGEGQMRRFWDDLELRHQDRSELGAYARRLRSIIDAKRVIDDSS